MFTVKLLKRVKFCTCLELRIQTKLYEKAKITSSIHTEQLFFVNRFSIIQKTFLNFTHSQYNLN